ncbi:MAG: hypothetical protein JXR48_07055 [Candidatus Delongbacteria bacterium]|nr:hypothetical protein [Candidatus Delongbacteria bacterium]MBN2834709.1 hypothetical protein [Candidatus Delongbacteria bacterium]
MLNRYYLTLIMIIFSNLFSAKILFVGNSYTYSNNLPEIIASFAIETDKQYEYQMIAPGGCTLKSHYQDGNVLNALENNHFDFTILQEQSQIPVVDYVKDSMFIKYAIKLDALIKQNGSDTMLFMTWGRKNGGTQSYGGYSSPEFANFENMQDSLNSTYTRASECINSEIAEIGEGFRISITSYPEIELFSNDGSHPSYAGSYLAALIFYSKLFQCSTQAIQFHGSLDSETAETLKNISDQITGFNPIHEENYSNQINFDLLGKSIELYNISGQKLPFKGNYNDLPSGIFILRQRNEKGFLIKKIINRR